MTFVVFIVVLTVLILVHELGHFVVAKLSGMRVDEFGIGFPPRLFSFRRGETVFSINIIPFGGFVRIHGESLPEEGARLDHEARSFSNKPRYLQSAVLVAGVLCNALFAWILISAGFMSGLPVSASDETRGKVHNPRVLVTAVIPGGSAEENGLAPGDAIISLTDAANGATLSSNVTIETIQEFIRQREGVDVALTLTREGRQETVHVVPERGVIGPSAGIGIAMEFVGTLKLPIHRAVIEGARLTWNLAKAITLGLVDFFSRLFLGRADFSEVSGPVGIAGLVGSATRLGIGYLMSFTALISLNLAILNLVPFPALDGGRLLIVIIEAIRRKPIPVKIAHALNTLGFAILIALMVAVTAQDVFKLI